MKKRNPNTGAESFLIADNKKKDQFSSSPGCVVTFSSKGH